MKSPSSLKKIYQTIEFFHRPSLFIKMFSFHKTVPESSAKINRVLIFKDRIKFWQISYQGRGVLTYIYPTQNLWHKKVLNWNSRSYSENDTFDMKTRPKCNPPSNISTATCLAVTYILTSSKKIRCQERQNTLKYLAHSDAHGMKKRESIWQIPAAIIYL